MNKIKPAVIAKQANNKKVQLEQGLPEDLNAWHSALRDKSEGKLRIPQKDSKFRTKLILWYVNHAIK